MNEEEHEAGLAPTPGYRYADVFGDQLFVAGQVPHDDSGSLVGVENPRRQAAACLDNLHRVMEVHGFSPTDIRRLVVYAVGERECLSDAWAGVTEWFDGSVPPATLLGVNLLGYNEQLVEVDATIVRRRIS